MDYRKETVSRKSANRSIATSLGRQAGDGIVDNRPQAIAQRQLMVRLDQSTAAITDPVQCVEDEELLQGKFETTQRVEDEELLQGKFVAGASPAQLQEQTAVAENKMGLPDKLKTGIESLSGMDMSDVRVHRNSSKPAQLNAHAYAQGNDIHLGSGQEKHLPHEAWHVVQQRQGRVKPTMQMAGAQINDDVSLEREADVMGVRAFQRTEVKQLVRTSKYDREAKREAKYSSTVGGGTTVFNNNEGKLPKAPKGQHYIETDSGQGRNNRGQRRIVSLVETGSGRVLRQYLTGDHYETFQKLR